MVRHLALLCFLPSLLFAAVPPAAPVITEPEADGQAYSAADVHMATAPLHDDDGDEHRCSDWEIVHESKPVWTARCANGSSRIHIHLGDGIFTDGRAGLIHAAAYVLRVRHRDGSGVPATEWSDWSERTFLTAPASPMAPMLARDFVSQPAPRWTRSDGTPLALPSGASLRLEAADGEPFFEWSQQLGVLAHSDAPPFAARGAVRAVLTAGDGAWTLPESQVSLFDDDANEQTIFLPAITLTPSTELPFWVSANGSVHSADHHGRAPDFTHIVRGAPVPWTATQKGYRVELVAGGFQLPINIAFVPSPRDDPDAPFFYVTELYGDIKVVTRGGQVRDYAKGLIDFYPGGSFPGEGETGLVGIAVEPESGDVLVTSLYLNVADAWTYPRILRLSSDDGGLTAARVTTVLDMPFEQQSPSHQISNLTIGPDGKVYFHMGDAHYAPYAQSLETMRGKILRMNLDGSAPADNPFYNASDGITSTDYIFALGFRNPFGGAWRAADGMLYEVENGPAVDRFARVDRGRNYGWDGTNDSMREGSICEFTRGAAPVNVAFVQSETFGGSGFPSEKWDRAFITESGPTWDSGTPESGKRISEVALRPDGTLESGPTTLVRYNGTGKATVAGIAAGPDGLYFTGLYKDFGYVTPVDRGASVFRVRWVGYADFSLRIQSEDPLRIELTDRSVVLDAVAWHWDFGDGTTSDERDAVHRYDQAGTYIVALTVTSENDTLVTGKKIHLTSGGSGLRAQFFSNADFTGESVQTTEPMIDWEHAPPSSLPADVFSVRWRGRLRPRVSESHRLIMEAAGDVRLWIDGELVIDDGTSTTERSGDAMLEAGRFHDIVIEYVHRGGPALPRLSWESETQPRAVVPASVLFTPLGLRRRTVRN